MATAPPPPPGFELDAAQSQSAAPPPPPDGFTLDKAPGIGQTAIRAGKSFAGQSLSNLSPIKLASGAIQMVANPKQTVQSELDSMAGYRGKASQAAKKGDISTAALYELSGVVPVIGPMAGKAVDAMEAMDPEALGKASADITSLKTVPKVYSAAGKAITGVRGSGAAQSTADALQRSAEKNIYTALHPTKVANKVLVENKIAPGLVQRGVVSRSLKSLGERAEEEAGGWSDKIDNYLAQNGQREIPNGGADIVRRINDEIATKTKGGVTPSVSKPYIKQLRTIREDVIQLAKDNGGKLTLENIRWLRQQYDPFAASKNAFAMPPKVATQIKAVADGMNTVRDTISKNFPDLAELNKQFNFWQNTHDVVQDSITRKVGQRGPMTRKVAAAAGGAIGAALGGPKGAMAGAEAANEVSKFKGSTLWNTAAAQAKARTGNLIRGGPPPIPPPKQRPKPPAAPPAANTPPIPPPSGPVRPPLNKRPVTVLQTNPPGQPPQQMPLTTAPPAAPAPVAAAATVAPPTPAAAPPVPRTSVTLQVPGVGPMSFPIGTPQEVVEKSVREAQAIKPRFRKPQHHKPLRRLLRLHL